MRTPLSNDDNLVLAEAYARASRGNDADALRVLSAAGAVTWHNFDEVEVTTEQTVRTLAWLHRLNNHSSSANLSTKCTMSRAHATN